MSWNFSVTGNNAQEAFEKFQEALWKNGHHVPFAMGDEINKAAGSLAQASLDAQNARLRGGSSEPQRRVRLESYGHFNEEGDGNVGVTLHVLPPEPASADSGT